MKHLFVLVVLCMSIVTAHAAGTTQKYEANWFEQIFQSLTGTQATTENPKITHTTIRKNHRHKHGHRHASTIHKSHASAGVTKSPVHTENEKLYEEFKAWRDMQELYKLFNPIQH